MTRLNHEQTSAHRSGNSSHSQENLEKLHSLLLFEARRRLDSVIAGHAFAFSLDDAASLTKNASNFSFRVRAIEINIVTLFFCSLARRSCSRVFFRQVYTYTARMSVRLSETDIVFLAN